MLRWLGLASALAAKPCRERPADALWQDAFAALAGRIVALGGLGESSRQRLHALAMALLDAKAVNGAGSLEVDEAMAASIALQAALPILELGLDAYPRFEEIVVYPGDFLVDRRLEDDDGVVHEWREAISGESWDGGPVVLAWDAAAGERRGAAGRPMPFAFNVVLHEFAHKLDFGNGRVDGVPAFSRRLHPGWSEARWRDALEPALDHFAGQVDAVEAAIPRHVDPDSIRADPYYAPLPLDAYAATDEAEFFSVSSEAFFVTPARLRDAFPDWYAALAAYYRQDPLA